MDVTSVTSAVQGASTPLFDTSAGHAQVLGST